MPLNPGTRLGPYEITSALGAGGMGELYRAWDPRLRRNVAVKVLPDSVAADPDRLQRFRQEALAVAALNHPNILTIFDIGSENGRPYVVFELLEGQTLLESLAGGRLPVASVLNYGIQIAEGLAAAHGAGVTHRDLKPANLFVTADNRVKILDFGLAKLDAAAALSAGGGTTVAATERGVLLGTVGYMAPEQVRGEPVDRRCDIFALGAILYELLCGRPAFGAHTAADALTAVLRDHPPPPSRQVAGLPARLDAIVARCLEKDPGRRFQSAGELLEELVEARAALARKRPSSGSRRQTRAKAGDRLRATLSVSLTRLVGRDRERRELGELLARLDVRLVALTGPAGTGKTRLAAQIVEDVAEQFADGACFVQLSAITDAALVAPTLLGALGVRASAGRPAAEHLIQSLRDREMLVVLDNFEQLMAAGLLVPDLLKQAPALKILVTSRAPLRVRGEHEYPLAPLPFPPAPDSRSSQAVGDYPAVALFVERASAVRPDFRLTDANAPVVAEICRRLDGLPLAIELAAARTQLLTPEAMLARLDRRLALLTGGGRDLPARQQTLRGALDWSYELLTAGEQQIFRCLAVFAGGCTLEAAEATCGAAGDIPAIDGIASLVDKSLVRPEVDPSGEPRIVMLQTVREYALEQLASEGEADRVRQAHAAFFLALAEAWPRDHATEAEASWLDRLDREHDNLRGALDAFVAAGDTQGALRLTVALWRFWEVRGHATEGRRQLTRALALPWSSEHAPLRQKALYAAGVLADAQGDYGAARTIFESHLLVSRQLGDPRATATSLNNLGIVALRQGDYATARALYDECRGIFVETGDRKGLAWAYYNLAQACACLQDDKAARAYYEQSLTLSRELGDQSAVAWVLNNLGDLARAAGDLPLAASRYQESLTVFEATGDTRGVAGALADLGDVARDRGDEAAARSQYSAACAMFRQLGDRRGLARILDGFATLAAGRGEAEAALRLAGAASVLREKLGTPLAPRAQQALDERLAPARAGLARSAAEAAWQSGRQMSADEALAAVLE